MKTLHISCVFLSAILGADVFAGPASDGTPSVGPTWNQTAAASYLDAREMWWQSWQPAQRDHETLCVSCHTVVPYALSRPALRHSLAESEMAAPERVMLENVRKRVSMWKEVQPFYLDATSGPNKSVESRSTESVLNALILASYDSGSHLDAVTRSALENAWALQLTTGAQAGSWNWQVFKLAPWESGESQYQGAAFMALATGLAPDGYAKEATIQPNLALLRSYLQRDYSKQPLVNQLVVLWASARLPGLLPAADRKSLLKKVADLQRQDGGWSLSSFGTWEREDHTPLETTSDGYATGLAVLALEENGMPRSDVELKNGLAWLVSHQDHDYGDWHTSSLNKQRDPQTNVGRFMSDAATGYAVLALEKSR